MVMLSVFQALSLFRISILITTIFTLSRGILGFEIYQIKFWLNFLLIMTIVHMITEIIRYKYVKNTRIITSLFLTMFWIIFVNAANMYIFIASDHLGLQVLTCSISFCILTIYLYQNLRRSFEALSLIKIGSRLLITLSFLLVIAIGTILLMLPLSRLPNQSRLHLVDAFFTSVSAVCVTGLTVVDTVSYFSRFGQIILAILIQIGSLGLVTITTTFINLLGKKISLTGHLSTQDSISNVNQEGSFGNYLLFIAGFTIVTEVLIALALFTQFIKILPVDDALFYCFFHAISAFCNAGFALFPNSLMDFRTDIVINGAVATAIIMGGLGFGTWKDLKSRFINRTKKSLSLQTIITLRVSAVLILAGSIGFFILEKDFALKELALFEQVLCSIFASVNLRTSGFQTIDLSQTQDASRLFSLFFMYVGASPGSTGGGIKTTSFMVLLASVGASLSNQNEFIIFGKKIESNLVTQTWTLIFHSFSWIFLATTLLCAVDQLPLSGALYEIFSAYGTVGVTVGYTTKLSYFSKIIVSITMILGRVGPTTVMLALMGKSQKPLLIRTLPENLSIG